MFQLPDGVYDSVGVGEDAVDVVSHLRRGSTGHLNNELQLQPEGVYETPEGVYETLTEARNNKYERPVRSADAESEEHEYIELPQTKGVYDTPQVAGNTEYEGTAQEPHYMELPPLESVYETVGVAVKQTITHLYVNLNLLY